MKTEWIQGGSAVLLILSGFLLFPIATSAQCKVIIQDATIIGLADSIAFEESCIQATGL